VAKKLKLNMGAKKSARSEDGGGFDALADSRLGKVLKDSAQEIWLAGLGAYARAQDEGSKVFETLVKAGQEIESRTRSVAGGTVEAMASKAAGTWSKLEQVFEDRVARSLNRLGVPSGKEMKELSGRIAELNASVQSLVSKGTSAKKPSPKKAAPSATAKKPGPKNTGKPAARKSAKQPAK
jgi:poly(hydroxyalkanoate) granule-associated protein